jgi:hypothetical protein
MRGQIQARRRAEHSEGNEKPELVAEQAIEMLAATGADTDGGVHTAGRWQGAA